MKMPIGVCRVVAQTVPIAQKQKALLFEAFKWLGVREQDHYRGQVVEMFQRIVGRQAVGTAWCMEFVQYCIREVDAFMAAAFGDKQGSPIFKSSMVLDTWSQSPKDLRLTDPEVGSVVMWQTFADGKPTDKGHTGIVYRINDDGSYETIEGNVFAPDHSPHKGVFTRSRQRGNTTDLGEIGFLKVWSTIS